MNVNISYLEVPLDYQLKNLDNSKLRYNMWLTAEPLYKTKSIEFNKLIDIVKSDYRQYTPFVFKGGKKVSENWDNSNQNLLIFDIDDGLSINEAMNIFRDYNYLIATTKSHQVDKKGVKCDRFRVIIPSDNIPRGEDYFKLTDMLEKKYPLIDKQVNTKTGAFLGFFNCQYWYNKGKNFDCGELIENYNRLNNAMLKESNHTPPTKQNYSQGEPLPIEEIKSRLSRELIADIISSCGFDVNRKFMFKMRQDERTPSASIKEDGLIKDFGGDFAGDIIDFIIEVKGVDLKTAVEIIGGYTNVKVVKFN